MTLLYCLLCAILSLTLFGKAEEAEQAEPEARAEVKPLRKTTEAESAAIEAFRVKMTEAKAAFAPLLQASGENPASAYQLAGHLHALLSKVETDGLPKDLAKAFSTYVKAVEAIKVSLKDMPKEEAAIMEWIAKQNEDEKFSAQQNALSEKQFEQESKLAGIAAEFGIEKEVRLYENDAAAENETKDRWVVILGAYKNFPEAKTDALKFSKASKVPFSMNGMIYDKKGLRLPDDSEDEVYAGEYLLRRFNITRIGDKDVENHISIEKSDAYDGFEPGFYIIVGNIAESSEDADKQLEKFKPIAKKPYAKQTKIFLGCIH